LKQLDFIIIGAQKSATTSLFRYLNEHPRIHMPADKEAPFFSDDQLYRQGWQSFVEAYFADAPEDRLWGTASPQYMGDPRAVERIHRQNPEARLIALLRNPIDRAFSHFVMSVRRGMEQRDFDQVVTDLLQPERLAAMRDALPPDHSGGYQPGDAGDTGHYLVWSEYGRILQPYYQLFGPERMLIIYLDELTANPLQTVDQVMSLLALEPGFAPKNLGKVYHKGGAKRIIPDSWKERLKANGLFRLIWDRVPPRTRGVLNYWYEQMNVRADAANEAPSQQARELLRAHFRPDLQTLQQLTGRLPPWPEFGLVERPS
jgi:hypothetical protein